MIDWIQEKNAVLCDFLWGPYMLGLFLFTGLFFTITTGFFQFRHMPLWLRFTFCSLFKKEKSQKGTITQFQALSTALAATVGTGNITGVAAALVSGGPGAIFWMWVSSLLGMMTAYAENVLGILYRYKDKNGSYKGGAMLYIEKGLGSKFLAVLFSVFCIFASFGMGNMAQMHSVASALESSFQIPPIYTGVACSLLVAVILKGGLSRTAKVTERLVPFMVLLFFAGSLICLFVNIEKIPIALGLIFRSAFSMRPMAGGVIGYGIMQALRTGVSRGVFSNEAGLGSSVAVHAASSTKEPVIQGMWAIFEVFVDTIMVCTLTALVILTSDVYTSISDTGTTLTGVSLTAKAFEMGIGPCGSIFISISIVFFAFATVLGWSCFGEQSAGYLFGAKGASVYRILYIPVTLLGAVGSMELVWSIADTFNALMALPNLFTLLILSGTVRRETKRFLNGSLSLYKAIYTNNKHGT